MTPPNYLSYLLRLWRIDQAGQFDWRASLEAPMTGVRQNFPDLEQLFAYLRSQLASAERDTASEEEIASKVEPGA